LIQYPLTPRTISSADYNLLKVSYYRYRCTALSALIFFYFYFKAQIKPNQEKLQLTLEIDTETRYDKSRGINFVKDAKGNQKTKKKKGKGNDASGTSSSEERSSSSSSEDDEAVIEEQVLESVPLPKSAKSTHYALALVKDGQIRSVHLTSISNILQMKNTLPYLDEAAEKRNKENLEPDSNEADAEATKITVKFTEKRTAATMSDAAAAAKARTPKNHSTFQKKLAEEAWIELNPGDDNDRKEMMDKLFSKAEPSPEAEEPKIIPCLPEDYYKVLFPKAEH